ncbi:MAG: TrmH family RNA methyltransferase [Mycoplasma sp.]
MVNKMMEITSKENSIIKNIVKKLNDKKNNVILLDSLKIFEESNSQSNNLEYILCTNDWYEKNYKSIEPFKDKLILTTIEIIQKINETKNSTPCCFILNLKIPSFELSKDTNYLILDHISDPGNLGALLRVAVAFNFNNIYISNNSVNLTNQKVVRSSMSAINKIKVNKYDDLLELSKKLTSNNIDVLATALDVNAKKLSEFECTKPFALILGNEANGIDLNVLNNLDNKIYIEINNIQSLNVVSAGSIILYNLSEQAKQWKK